MESTPQRETNVNHENKEATTDDKTKPSVNDVNITDRKRERLIKIKRSSGEIQYVTREELDRLNKEKSKRKQEEKERRKSRNRKLAISGIIILVVVTSYLALWLFKRNYNNRISQQNDSSSGIIATELSQPPVGQIKVIANVDGAAIYLNGRLTSQVTDKISGIVLDSVPVGTNKIAVTMPGYLVYPEDAKEIEVTDNKMASVTFDLVPKPKAEQAAAIKPKNHNEANLQTRKGGGSGLNRVNTAISRASNPSNRTIEIKTPNIETVDVAPPKVIITNGPPVTITDNSVTFVLNSNEPATYSCYLEGYDSGYSEFTSGNIKRYENLKDGSYTFYAKAKDLSGNITPEPASSSFLIDTTPPNASIIEGPSGIISQRDATFKFSAKEQATFSFYLSGYENGYSSYFQTSSKSYYNLPDGSYTFYVKARDEVGNEDIKPAERTFTIDTKPPGATITSGPKGLITYNDVTINFAATEPESFKYYLSNRESEFSNPTKDTSVNYANLPDGSYTFYVRAKDKAGNIDKEPAFLSFTIDTSPPKTTITEGPKGKIAYDDVTIMFTANEKATFSYYLEGYDKDYSDYTSEYSKTYQNLPDGTYKFYVKSKDMAGNVEKNPVSRSFIVETVEVLFKEDFEDEKRKINAGDFNKSDGAYYWGRSSKRHKSGKFSLWCAGANDQKDTTDRTQYNKNMSAWYEIDVNLSYYKQAKLSFWYYLDTTNDVTDRLSVRVAPKNKATKKDYTGFKILWKAPIKKNGTLNWVKQNISLNEFSGKPVVIRIYFDSDNLIQDEGAYIDDIVIIGKY